MSNRRAFVFGLRWRLLLSAAAWISFAGSSLLAANTVVKKLTSGLGSPISIVIRPEGGSHSEAFVADGAKGRILRIALDHSDVSEEVITGFPQHHVSEGKSVTWGLQSLYFLDHARLLASGGDDKQPFIRLYELPDSGGALQFDDSKQNIEIAAESQQELENAGVVGFHSIARTRGNDHVSDMLLLGTRSEKSPIGLWKIPLRANTLEDAVPFQLAKADGEIRSIDAVAIGNSGYVAVAASTAADVSHCILRFVDPTDGRSRLDVPTDLESILEMAYNPTTGDLFAVGLEASPPHASGLYRLDDVSEVGQPRCRAKKIATLAGPTALAFSSDGTLFVTCEETTSGGDPAGGLYKLNDF